MTKISKTEMINVSITSKNRLFYEMKENNEFYMCIRDIYSSNLMVKKLNKHYQDYKLIGKNKK